ncbi:DUF4258 domain-containing protein [uncultured Rhodospira sp.]|uniref:DUF4258 domain-containing protein n=1 Tax=uncultured Rhodospira sp. TaxID=1936189 RepID=UPI00260BCB7A|nr:DUF4258 domain-containing protein [uncultured Rhodospira sp.]
MFSRRFQREVRLTRHARDRMSDRAITVDMLVDVLETGDVRWKDDIRGWIAKHVPEREDNLICLVVVLEDAVVIKTVMHHFEWEA